MFTGIVETTGKVLALEKGASDIVMRIDAHTMTLEDVALGDSLCVNGVCLTAVTLDGHVFTADVSRETLTVTNFRGLKVGDRVNLEKSLTLAKPLGGHLVTGHVDGRGNVMEYRQQGRCKLLRIKVPDELARYICHKGSICVDGVSLTVNGITGVELDLQIIPHTVERTVLADYQPGRWVNIEVDIVARYLERLISADRQNLTDKQGVTMDKLAQFGFAGQR